MTAGAWAEPRPEAVQLAVAVALFNEAHRQLQLARLRLRLACDAEALTAPRRRPAPVCGTPGGYAAHRRHDQTPDPACVEGHSWTRVAGPATAARREEADT